MQASRILPDLQCSLVCEGVRPEANGSLILIGVIDLIRVPQVPVTAGQLCIFNRWTAGFGQFTETVRLVAPDQTTILGKREMKFALANAARNATNVTVFSPVQFEFAGTYYVEISVDDVMKIRYPLPVVVVPPPTAAQPQNPIPA